MSIAGILIGSLVIAGCVGKAVDPGTDTTLSPSAVDYAASISAATLVKSFEDNEDEAIRLFKDKTILVYGKAASATTGGDGRTLLTFRSSIETDVPVTCVFDKSSPIQQKSISEGRIITVAGKVIGFGNSRDAVVLENCRFQQLTGYLHCS